MFEPIAECGHPLFNLSHLVGRCQSRGCDNYISGKRLDTEDFISQMSALVEEASKLRLRLNSIWNGLSANLNSQVERDLARSEFINLLKENWGDLVPLVDSWARDKGQGDGATRSREG